MSHVARVLVVEDDAGTQTLLRKQLTAKGFQVTVARNGLDGLMQLEGLLPDVIVCDINMPELDGIGFVRAIKAKNETRKIPVIFLTASNDARHMVDGINVGARFYLTKPFELNELIWKINRVLAGNGG
ncbi:MAG: DNA-binding response regulator, LuxR family [bacterium]|nr:DNA-binding response regulator, LuxR family [bacterium]